MKSFVLVSLFNLIVIYLILLSFNVFLSIGQHAVKELVVERKAIEDKFKNLNKLYFANCLAPEWEQLWFPDLSDSSPFRESIGTHNFLALGSQPHKKVSYCNEGYGFIKYKTDRMGFRNADPLWDSKIDILMVGDSYVQGACVTEDHHPSSWTNRHSNYRSVNVGSASNGPPHYANLVRHFVQMLKPKYLVVYFYPNDNKQVKSEKVFLAQLKKPLDTSSYTVQGLSPSGVNFFADVSRELDKKRQEHQGEYSCSSFEENNKSLVAQFEDHKSEFANFDKYSRKNILNWFRSLSAAEKKRSLFKLGALKSHFLESNLSVDPLSSKKSTQLALASVRESCDKWGCTPILVTLPNSPYWRPDWRSEFFFDYVKKMAATELKNLDFHILDMVGKMGMSDFAPAGPHYSVEGYQKLNQELLDLISSIDKD